LLGLDVLTCQGASTTTTTRDKKENNNHFVEATAAEVTKTPMRTPPPTLPKTGGYVPFTSSTIRAKGRAALEAQRIQKENKRKQDGSKDQRNRVRELWQEVAGLREGL
jgi:hypothetical protein